MKFAKVNIAAILIMCISYAQAQCSCQQITTVVNGQNVSSCKPTYIFYQISPPKSNDIDECKAQPSPCEQVCTNTIGSYTCSCNAGYVINRIDPRRCDDINECSAQPSPCQQICINTAGSFTCLCRPGFAVNSMDPTKCDADCVPLSSEIIKTRNLTSALKCYSACRIEHCYSFKFANGLCTIKLYAGDAVDFSQNVVAGSFISCYNENSQCTLKSEVESSIPLTGQPHEDCFYYCLGDPDCIGYHYFPGVYCINTYTVGSAIDIKKFPLDKFVYLNCDK